MRSLGREKTRSPDATRQSLSATKEEIAALLDRLDAGDSGGTNSGRQSERFPYRISSCAVTIKQIGAEAAVTTLVPTRNLSASGMSFLYQGFVHTGSLCQAELLTSEGGLATVNGTVARCRYVEKWIHEVAVRFTAEVCAADFCQSAPLWNVLFASGHEESVRQASHHLTVSRANVEIATSSNQLLEMTGRRCYDCVLLEADLPALGGVEATKAMRDCGYTGVIIGIVGDDDPSVKKDMIAGGCAQCLSGPYTAAMIKAARDATQG